jgi:hypothetical protein
MQRYLLDLNYVIRAELGGGQYVTMVAVGFHGRRGLAVMTNAGHPPPLWQRASRGEWSWLETNRDSEREQPVGLPLDLFDDTRQRPLLISADRYGSMGVGVVDRHRTHREAHFSRVIKYCIRRG